jgi:trigger factor
MAQTATKERKPTVKITDAGPSRKKLHIEIPAETVSEKLAGSMDALAEQAQLPGFRKGKAPRQLIEKRFGPSVRSEAKDQLVAQAYQDVVKEHKLKVLGQPTSETLGGVELVPGKALSVELEVEVLPEFELPSLDGIKVFKPLIEVKDEMVEKDIENLRINEGELESRESGEAGDYCTGHAVMKGKDGTEFYNIQGAVIQVPTADKKGKGMILGVMVEDFSKQIGTPKPGATLTVKTKGPENHEVEAIRNADLTVTFTVDRVDRIIPAPMDRVLSALGMETEAQLKDAVKARITTRVMVEQQTAMRNQLAKHLLENTKMELPQRMTSQQAARTLERRRLELMYRGVKPTEIEEHMAELRAASASVAGRDLKLFFILNKAAEDLKVNVTEGEMNQRIAQMAAERGVRPDKLRQEIIGSNQAGGLFQQIRDHKTMDQILAKASVEDMAVDEFNKKFAGKQN